MNGQDFLDHYQGTNDPVTRIDPTVDYAIKTPTEHPIYENRDVHRFKNALESSQSDINDTLLGDLMRAAHQRYSRCGLGTEQTDALVDLVYEYGLDHGLIGAKITGGGSGGTVAVLGHTRAADTIGQLLDEFAARYGYSPTCFEGSSDGAMHRPVVVTRI